MRKAILIFFSTSLLVGGLIYWLMHGGISPKAIRVLNPTYFASPEEIGAVIARRFWQEIRDSKVVVLASHPLLRDYDRVWKGFMAVAAQQGYGFTEVTDLPGLRELSPFQGVGLSSSANAVNPLQRKLVHIVATNEQWATVKRDYPEAMVIFQGQLVVRDSDLGQIIPKCEEKTFNSLGCLSEMASRPHFRKHRDPSKLSATMERHGVSQYVLFVHEPQAN